MQKYIVGLVYMINTDRCEEGETVPLSSEVMLVSIKEAGSSTSEPNDDTTSQVVDTEVRAEGFPITEDNEIVITQREDKPFGVASITFEPTNVKKITIVIEFEDQPEIIEKVFCLLHNLIKFNENVLSYCFILVYNKYFFRYSPKISLLP